jgi:DNA modification methylase
MNPDIAAVLAGERQWCVVTGDCRDILPTLPDKSVDAVVTDPPYGKQWARGDNAIGSNPTIAVRPATLGWDSERPSRDCFNEIRRVSHMQIIWGGNYFADYLGPTNCMIAWDKTGGLAPTVMADFELAWCSLNKVARIFRLMNRGFVRECDDERLHPTQKPEELMRWCIELYTKLGQTILDPFCGSGTTGVAAVQLGRRFIGVEIDPGYAKIATERIDRAARQGRLAL